MKTTIDLPDALLAEAREAAEAEGTTLKALVESGLRRLLDGRGTKTAFKLRRASFKGNGLQPDMADGSWEGIRARVYQGHGE
jgi:Arc/MetJ family transcription regulator